jgi:hypothetical protein
VKSRSYGDDFTSRVSFLLVQHQDFGFEIAYHNMWWYYALRVGPLCSMSSKTSGDADSRRVHLNFTA